MGRGLLRCIKCGRLRRKRYRLESRYKIPIYSSAAVAVINRLFKKSLMQSRTLSRKTTNEEG